VLQGQAHIAISLLLPAMSWAQQSSDKSATNGLTYDYVSVGYANILLNSTFKKQTLIGTLTGSLSGTMHGTSLEGSKLIAENFYLFGNYFSTSTDSADLKFSSSTLSANVDYKQYQISAGYRRALKPGTDVIASVSVVNSSSRVNSGDSTESNVYPVSVGLKTKLMDSIEASASGIIVSGDLASVVNLHYKINDQYAIGGYFRHDPKINIYSLNVRYLF
jgi:hypothetical protein